MNQNAPAIPFVYDWSEAIKIAGAQIQLTAIERAAFFQPKDLSATRYSSLVTSFLLKSLTKKFIKTVNAMITNAVSKGVQKCFIISSKYSRLIHNKCMTNLFRVVNNTPW